MPVLQCERTIEIETSAKRHQLGQFPTPRHVADFMASMLHAGLNKIDLLDAGAGTGALVAAFVRRIEHEPGKLKSLSITAYEVDSALMEPLHATLSECRERCDQARIAFEAEAHNEDFISVAAPFVRGNLFAPQPPRFNVAIVNPPYRKIRSDSATRHLLRSAGIETGNLYAAFVALIIKLLDKGGELVAITPRSFCNGPYFKAFRVEFLKTMSLRRIHVFESRSAAFGKDDVLQENIIVHAVKGEPRPDRVLVSTSSGRPDDPVRVREVDYTDVVTPEDPEQFIHLVAEDNHHRAKSLLSQLSAKLAELGLEVSTGRVVDFRSRQFLRQQPNADTAPLIYPCHLSGGHVHWPKLNARKPNAIISDERTRELLVPAGVYVLVKRFTAKEEPRRVVAAIYDPNRIDAPWVGFENHLNYFHLRGQGLTMNLAKGLTAFLNSTVVDDFFRRFSGHTQVNATDLRILNYPTKSDLERLGHRISDTGISQDKLDTFLEAELFR